MRTHTYVSVTVIIEEKVMKLEGVDVTQEELEKGKGGVEMIYKYNTHV